MFQFNLFAEWRNRRLYGESLATAVASEKTLQRPDRPSEQVGFGQYSKATPGEVVTVAKVLGARNTDGVARGGKSFVSVLFQDHDGKIHDVDAEAIEITLS